MTTDLPIACTLGAGDLRQRLGAMAALGADAYLDGDRAPLRAVLRFTAGTGTRERLEAVVAAEARCCAFLSLTLADAPDTLVLTIEGPDGAEPAIAEIAETLTGGER